MRIVGIDPSMTSTGIAVITDDINGLAVATHRIESAPPKRARGDKTPVTLAERRDRLRGIAAGVLDIVNTRRYALDYPDLAVIEGPSYSSAGAGTWDRAGLWWLIVNGLSRMDTAIALVPPTTRAKWATGSGAAGKSPIAVHLSRMWPDVDLAISDDEWDALSLATIGAQHLGVIPCDLARHREQLDRILWPDIPSPIEAAS